MTTYNKLHKIITEAVPEILDGHTVGSIIRKKSTNSNQRDAWDAVIHKGRHIILADVLRAVNAHLLVEEVVSKWNLKQNTLKDQSEETQEYLLDLLT